jgi:cysteine-rich repeat protein
MRQRFRLGFVLGLGAFASCGSEGANNFNDPGGGARDGAGGSGATSSGASSGQVGAGGEAPSGGTTGMAGESNTGGELGAAGSAGAPLVNEDCGNDVLDVIALEECDDGNTDDGDGCDAQCQLEPVGGALCGNDDVDDLEKCDPPEDMPADGDGCNATCNLSGEVTTLNTDIDAGAITSDNTNLYLAIFDCMADECGIAKIDIAACNAAPGTAACEPEFISGGPGQCECTTGMCPTLNPANTVVDGDKGTATFADMNSLATDGTTIWISHQQVLREVDIATGDVTTVAGTTDSCAAIDGNGTDALFHTVAGLTYLDGLVYLLDRCERVLRAYDPSTGDVETLAGQRDTDTAVTQTPPYDCPSPCDQSSCANEPSAPSAGTGTEAEFVSPRYMTADSSGVLYVVDTNGEAIMSYDTGSAEVEILVAGTDTLPDPYVDGDAAAATLGRPRGITSDGTSVYLGEQYYGTIRQLDLSTSTISTFVGTNGCVAGNSEQPRDGRGANTTNTFGTNFDCTNAPATPVTPIFNSLVDGVLTFNFASKSIYVVDAPHLRRIE